MRICLIIPPSPFLLEERVFPSLGILKVATSLERAGHVVDVLDLSGVKNYIDVISDYLTLRPETKKFGVTATSPQMPSALNILDRLQGHGTRILGGPHGTLTHAAVKKSPRAVRALEELFRHAEIIVAGDGEDAIHQALLMERGLVDADDPNSALFLTHKGFEDSGWPARHLIDFTSYHYSIDGERSGSMISQLGCPLKCTFCGGRNSPSLRRIRLRSSDAAVAEMVHLYDTYGLKATMCMDDELNVNRSMLDLMRGLKSAADQRGIEWRLRGFIKSELFTPEQAEAMYAAGFRQILIGFESADERILLNIQKNATVADNTKAMKIAHDAGLKVKALMSTGHAGESEDTIRCIRDWLVDVKPSDFDCTIITPYPGSPYYDEAVEMPDQSWRYTAKTGDYLYMHDVDFTKEAQYYKGAPGSYVSHVWTDHISPERLVEMRDWVENEVRRELNIPFYQTGQSFEHSMGAGGSFLPKTILNSTDSYQNATQ